MLEIESLRIGGFKAYGGLVELPLTHVTLLFGANSSGKTSALQALLVLAHSVQAEVFPEYIQLRSSWYDLGGYEHVGRNDHPLTLGVAFQPDGDYSHTLDFSYTASDELNGPANSAWGNNLVYRRRGHRLELPLDYAEFDGRELAFWGFNMSLSDGSDGAVTGGAADLLRDWVPASQLQSLVGQTTADLVSEIGAPGEGELGWRIGLTERGGLLRPTLSLRRTFLSSPDEVLWDADRDDAARNVGKDDPRFVILAVLNQLASQFDVLSTFLSRVSYLGPVLDVPERIAVADQLPASLRSVGHRGQFLVHWLALQEPDLLAEISRVLNDVGCEYELKLERHELGVARTRALELVLVGSRGERLNLLDVGYGVSQLIPLVSEIVRVSREGGYLVIEQPELHLHPAWQGKVFDQLIGLAKEGAETVDGAGVLAETHSEHMVLSLRNARLEELAKSDGDIARLDASVAVQVVGQRDGCASFSPVVWDQELLGPVWPSGFFGERVELQRDFLSRRRTWSSRNVT